VQAAGLKIEQLLRRSRLNLVNAIHLFIKGQVSWDRVERSFDGAIVTRMAPHVCHGAIQEHTVRCIIQMHANRFQNPVVAQRFWYEVMRRFISKLNGSLQPVRGKDVAFQYS